MAGVASATASPATIVLADLSPDLRVVLAPLDVDASGTLSAGEIAAAINVHVAKHAAAKKQADRFSLILVVVTLAFTFLCACMAGVVYVVVGARASTPAAASSYAAAGVFPLLSTSGGPVHVKSTRAFTVASVTSASADADLKKLISVALTPADGSSASS